MEGTVLFSVTASISSGISNKFFSIEPAIWSRHEIDRKQLISRNTASSSSTLTPKLIMNTYYIAKP